MTHHSENLSDRPQLNAANKHACVLSECGAHFIWV
jgi:hypothetical protein